MEDCNAMHFCWTISPLHRQKLILAIAKAQPIWDCLLVREPWHTFNKKILSALHFAQLFDKGITLQPDQSGI